jgi:hypothetical protein
MNAQIGLVACKSKVGILDQEKKPIAGCFGQPGEPQNPMRKRQPNSCKSIKTPSKHKYVHWILNDWNGGSDAASGGVSNALRDFGDFEHYG